MGCNISWRNVDTGPWQGQGPGPIVSYCSSTDPIPSPGQCNQAITPKLYLLEGAGANKREKSSIQEIRLRAVGEQLN